MNDKTFHLLTLLDWSRRLAAGEDCAELAAWRDASPDAGWQWSRIMLAGEMLDAGLAGGEPTELGAEEVAALLDGGLDEAAGAAAIDVCWQSPVQLAEVASGARFQDESTLWADVSPNLTQRLFDLGPQPAKWRLNGVATHVLPMAQPLAPPVAEPQPASPVELPKIQPRSAMPRTRRPDGAVLATVAALVALLMGGALAWMAASSGPRNDQPPPIANNSAPPPFEPQPAPAPPRPEAPPPPAPQQNAAPLQEPPPAPPSSPLPSHPVPPSRPKRSGPAIPPRQAPPPAPPQLAFRTALGAVVVQDGGGPWRVAAGERPLRAPLRIASLAESYTAVEVLNVGTLICEGPVELELAAREGGLDILLVHGRLGVTEFAAGAQLRFQTPAARWTARGVDHYSTLAVLADPLSPQVLVPAGAVAVDQFNVAAQQRVVWQLGLPQPPQPIAASSGAAMNAAAPPTAPALGDPLDLSWLAPPDAERRKQWQAVYGRVVDRLAAAEDAGGELAKLLAASKDQRTAALLSRWNASVAGDAGRAAQIWAMLSDYRLFVRLAGVRTLLEMPPGDPRLVQFDALLRTKVPAGAADRAMQWLADVRQPAPLAGPRAVELVDFLGHNELALRQLAVSLLELHAAPVLTQARAAPPAYDAAGPAPRRAAGQAEWRQNLRRIFAPAKPMAAPLAPAGGS